MHMSLDSLQHILLPNIMQSPYSNPSGLLMMQFYKIGLKPSPPNPLFANLCSNFTYG